MFSPHVHESSKLIDLCFITGVSTDNINSYLINQSILLKPEILFSFPENKDSITNSILDVSECLI